MSCELQKQALMDSYTALDVAIADREVAAAEKAAADAAAAAAAEVLQTAQTGVEQAASTVDTKTDEYLNCVTGGPTPTSRGRVI